jgi:DNA-directed RNA polymerase beta' subunit
MSQRINEKFEDIRRIEYEGLPEVAIHNIEYSIDSYDDIINESSTPDGIRMSYDVKNPPPDITSTFSINMGCNEFFTKECPVCFQKAGKCPGHFGHINLTNIGERIKPDTPDSEKYYVYNPSMINYIFNLASIVCMNPNCERKVRTIILPSDEDVFPIGDAQIEKDKDTKTIREFLSIPRMNRLTYIFNKTHKVKCRSCGFHATEYDTTGKNSMLIRIQPVDKKAKNLPEFPYQIFNAFDRITDGEAQTLGFEFRAGRLMAHPRNMIIRALDVIPPVYRPMIKSEGRNPEPHSFTRSYNEIVDLLYTRDQTQPKIISMIQEKIGILFSNKGKVAIPGKPNMYTSVKESIQGRNGMIRDEMAGKRVNYAGRTVIGPGPNLKFNQVGVPREMAKLLTVPEVVTQNNLVYCQSLMLNDKINFHTPIRGPHAGNRMEIDPKYLYGLNLEIGDIVDRHLQDGDIVVYNRQPSLHKYSLMSGYVVLQDDNVVRINLCQTLGFNADFDGDEMNIHVPQTPDAIREAEILMNPMNNLISNQTSRPAYGQVLDTILGSYLLVKKDHGIPINVLMNANAELVQPKDFQAFAKRLDKYKVPIDSGKALFSLIFPDDFTYEFNKVSIREGIFISGEINKGNIGTSPGAILVEILKQYNSEIVSNFLTDNYKIIDLFNAFVGFSISFADIPMKQDKPIGMISEIVSLPIGQLLAKIEVFKRAANVEGVKIFQRVQNELLKRKLSDAIQNSENFMTDKQILNDLMVLCDEDDKKIVSSYIETMSEDLQDDVAGIQKKIMTTDRLTDKQIHDLVKEGSKNLISLEEFKEKHFEEINAKIKGLGDIGKTEFEMKKYESDVSAILNNVNAYIDQFLSYFLTADNRIIAMSKSGAKGNASNMNFMVGSIGQQNFKGERLAATMFGNRATALDLENDPNPENRGFCKRSLLDGLTPKEEFSHIAASREGLIDTATGVAETGYTQRRMMKSFEDIKVDSRGGVVNAKQKIIQFAYGEDGFSASSFRKVKLGNYDVMQTVDVQNIFSQLNAED